ncbi:unnamed protein product [Acanthoscelides obtectus]|uniref:Uncharacterized protein n=1 Tax=Acanthoscelides obtectus TaxID=200917 RepID=A0A9P0JMK6_ACAOB|nr:unnamed protein product [Acanthoscelides obtectus]CAK1635696.1 hypothetical protein AOBTE_LOCUS9446 [Acanthoscelides obtectus]
MFNFDNRH